MKNDVKKIRKYSGLIGQDRAGNELDQNGGAQQRDDDDHAQGHHPYDLALQFFIRSGHLLPKKSKGGPTGRPRVEINSVDLTDLVQQGEHRQVH